MKREESTNTVADGTLSIQHPLSPLVSLRIRTRQRSSFVWEKRRSQYSALSPGIVALSFPFERNERKKDNKCARVKQKIVFAFRKSASSQRRNEMRCIIEGQGFYVPTLIHSRRLGVN
jgi:hypothetical protein